MTDEINKNKFLDFLKSKNVAVISTVSEANQPMSATIYYVVDNDFNFYFMTKSFTRKFRNLKHNKEVALAVGTENTPVTAQIQGTAEQITDIKEFEERFKEMTKILQENKYVGPLFEIVANEDADHNEIMLFKVTPTWIRWLDLREDLNNNNFVQILP